MREMPFVTPIFPFSWAGSDLFCGACQVDSPNSRMSKTLPMMFLFQITSWGTTGNITKDVINGGGSSLWSWDFLNLCNPKELKKKKGSVSRRASDSSVLLISMGLI